ncbi:MAG: diacylglycerol kinase family protein [Pirellulaceae bacterium]|jgi:diacylglycerol kinase|nr:diacylglycerol kinase [Thermoguttaceae bacterium]MDI9442849.1 diacylglycerol kinase [Planctomycetota bacterium]NLZ03158.1 diacylglycerol kinase family protein [Pirellulaceae bacterium]
MPSPNRSWLTKFRNAFRGLWVGVARQNSFIVHLLAALAALVAALLLGVTPGKWCVLVIAITVVLVAELFNTALEHMAKAVTEEHHAEIRDALDTAAAAVLVAAAGSVVAGMIVFVPDLLKLLAAD